MYRSGSGEETCEYAGRVRGEKDSQEFNMLNLNVSMKIKNQNNTAF
jgi:hypothetical protein